MHLTTSNLRQPIATPFQDRLSQPQIQEIDNFPQRLWVRLYPHLRQHHPIPAATYSWAISPNSHHETNIRERVIRCIEKHSDTPNIRPRKALLDAITSAHANHQESTNPLETSLTSYTQVTYQTAEHHRNPNPVNRQYLRRQMASLPDEAFTLPQQARATRCSVNWHSILNLMDTIGSQWADNQAQWKNTLDQIYLSLDRRQLLRENPNLGEILETFNAHSAKTTAWGTLLEVCSTPGNDRASIAFKQAAINNLRDIWNRTLPLNPEQPTELQNAIAELAITTGRENFNSESVVPSPAPAKPQKPASPEQPKAPCTVTKQTLYETKISVQDSPPDTLPNLLLSATDYETVDFFTHLTKDAVQINYWINQHNSGDSVTKNTISKCFTTWLEGPTPKSWASIHEAANHASLPGTTLKALHDQTDTTPNQAAYQPPPPKPLQANEVITNLEQLKSVMLQPDHSQQSVLHTLIDLLAFLKGHEIADFFCVLMPDAHYEQPYGHNLDRMRSWIELRLTERLEELPLTWGTLLDTAITTGLSTVRDGIKNAIKQSH